MIKILLILILLLDLTPSVQARGLDFQEILDDFQEDVEDESTDILEGEKEEEGFDFDLEVQDTEFFGEEEDQGGIELPTFSGEGADVIVSAIRRFLDFFKLLVTPLAILFIVIMGIRMVAAGRENEEVITKSKNFIRYALEGLIVIFMADSIIEVFFGPEGEVLRGGEEGAIEAGKKVSTLFRGVYSLIQVVIGAIAVFVLVTAGMRYVGGSFSEDQIAKAKKQITWAVVGLFIVAISEFVVKDILFKETGTALGVEEAKQLFVQVTNFIAGTVGTLSFVFLFYAGYLYAFGVQNEDNVAKAKKIIIGAVIGIILALAAFGITNTIVNLDAS